jgi:hypothetical protein
MWIHIAILIHNSLAVKRNIRISQVAKGVAERRAEAAGRLPGLSRTRQAADDASVWSGLFGLVLARPLHPCQKTLGHCPTPRFELATSALPLEYTLKYGSCILDLSGGALPAHLTEREQRIVEWEAMPTSCSVSMLSERLHSTREALPALGQASRRQMAPDRRRAGAASEEATATSARFRLAQTFVHRATRPGQRHLCHRDISVQQEECSAGLLPKYMTCGGT